MRGRRDDRTDKVIAGTGIDIVEIPRMRDAIKKWGNSFISKVFTAREVKYSN